MKPSGIEWIGDIPDDWEVIKTKFLFNVYGGSTPKVNVSEYWGDKITWITPGELGDDIKIVLNSKRMLSEKGLNSCGATLVSKGSIIISNRAPIGQVCLAGSELCTNQGCKSLVAKIKLSCLFFYYFFKVQSEVLNMLGNGTTFMELSTSDLLNFKIPFPTIKEQQKIADYLDEKCGEIDATITKQKESIEKLKAYKQSLISETVTKGLDKSASLKPSGIDYLGDIPNDWEIRKVKNTGKLIGGSGFPEEYQGVKDEKIPFIKVKSLAEDPISRNGKDSISESIRSKLNAEKFIKGSVVFAKVGAALLLQRFRILEFDSCIDNNMMGFIPLAIEPRFFKYVTILFDFSYFVNPGTVPSINQEQIGNIKIPFPPLKSQEKIADYLDSKCSQIDKYITEKQNIIQKLDAYKKSLIFECITGKQKM